MVYSAVCTHSAKLKTEVWSYLNFGFNLKFKTNLCCHFTLAKLGFFKFKPSFCLKQSKRQSHLTSKYGNGTSKPF